MDPHAVSIETISRIRRRQGHATIIYEHIKIISKIERTRRRTSRRCCTAFRRKFAIFNRIRVRFSCSIGSECSDSTLSCEYRYDTIFFYYDYSLLHSIGFDFNVFIKIGLFAILFLIFIGIKLITNADEDYVRGFRICCFIGNRCRWHMPEQPHGIMSFVFISFII